MADSAVKLAWGHINVNVRDLDRSIAFYEKLGFEIFIPGIPYLDLRQGEELRALPDAGASALGLEAGRAGRACIMQLGDGFPKLDLTQLDEGSPESGGPLETRDRGIVRLCLASGDLAADYERLREAGVEFVSAPITQTGGLADVAVCLDPDGTMIELIQIRLEKWVGADSDLVQ